MSASVDDEPEGPWQDGGRMFEAGLHLADDMLDGKSEAERELFLEKLRAAGPSDSLDVLLAKTLDRNVLEPPTSTDVRTGHLQLGLRKMRT